MNNLMCEHVSWHRKSIPTAAMTFLHPRLRLRPRGYFYPARPPRKKTPDGRDLELHFVDIKKAYFNGIPRRRLHLFVPKELGLHKGAIARLKRCVYGTRDAGMIWEETYAQALLDMGFRRGLSSPCCFFSKDLQVAVVVYGRRVQCCWTP